jgi:hypothetical protein
MLKVAAIAKHLKYLKPVCQQFTAIRLYSNETPRVLITGLFMFKVCSAVVHVRYKY